MNTVLKTNLNFTKEDIFYPESDGQPMAETDRHRDLIIELIETLKSHFSAQKDVYITGNIMFYYVEGVPEEVVSPDVMVVFGVGNERRREYKLWEEKTPSVIIEIASHSTFKKDRTDKKELYESLGVQEYFIYNPEYPKTLPALLAYRLTNGEYVQIKVENKRVLSHVLEIELVDTDDWLRFFDFKQNTFILTPQELADEAGQRAEKAEVEADKAKARAKKAEVEADKAKARAEKAEAEIERLKAELAHLKQIETDN